MRRLLRVAAAGAPVSIADPDGRAFREGSRALGPAGADLPATVAETRVLRDRERIPCERFGRARSPMEQRRLGHTGVAVLGIPETSADLSARQELWRMSLGQCH